MTHSEISFNVNGKKVSFEIIHNLPPALDVFSALESWIHRTKDFTAKSFCNYITSKGFTAEEVIKK
jgi:hypothetical protein